MQVCSFQNLKCQHETFGFSCHAAQSPLVISETSTLFHLQISWEDIAGLDEVVSELQDTVILPFQQRHLFHHSRLCQPPRGTPWRRAT